MTGGERPERRLRCPVSAAAGGLVGSRVSPPLLARLTVTGGRPDLLPSRLPAAPAMAAAVGASTLAAAVIDASVR